MNCVICGRKTANQEKCKDCRYLLKNKGSEETLRMIHDDERTKRIWNENESIAEKLAQAYYDSVIDEYSKQSIQNDTKENFGFNTFVDGIRCGIDIIMPMLDDRSADKVKEKINNLIKLRKHINKHKTR